jgi:plastocyanin
MEGAMRREAVAGVVGAQVLALVWAGWIAAGAAEVEVKLFQFRPRTLDVAAGTAVTWVNRDDIGHTVTSGTPEAPGGPFDAALAGTASTATIRFAQPGVYPYFCRRHQAMRGEVRVR